MTNDLWHGTSGPPDAQIVLVGEAWGHEESLVQKPFVGEAGKILSGILAEAGIERDSILITNLARRVSGLKVIRCGDCSMQRTKHRMSQGASSYGVPPVPVAEVNPQLLHSPRRLVIACGNYAMWATSDATGYNTPPDAGGRRVPSGISNWRGSMYYMLADGLAASPVQSLTPLLPIIHPAAIMRQWSSRAVTVHRPPDPSPPSPQRRLETHPSSRVSGPSHLRCSPSPIRLLAREGRGRIRDPSRGCGNA